MRGFGVRGRCGFSERGRQVDLMRGLGIAYKVECDI